MSGTTPNPVPTVRKVAVLGGGLGGLTAALELTATPELRAKHEVTVYTEGWLLGGKCSSVRNAAEGLRNEELGLHMLMGAHEQTLHLLRDCYGELNRPPEDPLSSFEKAFSPRDVTALWERVDGAWSPWIVQFPRNERVPGRSPGFASERQLYSALLQLLSDGLSRVPSTIGAGRTKRLSPRIGRLLDRVRGLAKARLPPPASLVETASRLAEELAVKPDRPDPAHTQGVFWLTDKAIRLLGSLAQASDAESRRLAILLDLGRTILRGLIADGVLEKGFATLDGEDLIAWLTRHGSRHASAAPVLAFYGMHYAYPDGNWRQPMLAAGVGLSNLLRLFLDYRGALFYAPNAGPGETIFAPIYEVLRRRGVRFRFFQKVCALKPSTDGTRIERIRVGQQVRLKNLEYEPLVSVGAVKCWPAEPDYAQIMAPADLRKSQPRAHRRWPYAHFIGETVLQRGVDFHDVVLAIPAPALGEMVQDLVRSAPETWGRLLQNSRSVHTVGLQCWFQQTTTQMGWKGSPPLAGAYAAPLDNWADVSQRLPLESSGTAERNRTEMRACVQLSGVRPVATAELGQDEEIARLREICKSWMAGNSGDCWPEATTQQNPAGLDWRVLVDPKGRQGAARFDWQYVAASQEPSDAYVQSAPGTIQFRLAPGEAGFDNLYLAGDWVKTPLNSGTMEAAVASGIEAVQALQDANHAPVAAPLRAAGSTG